MMKRVGRVALREDRPGRIVPIFVFREATERALWNRSPRPLIDAQSQGAAKRGRRPQVFDKRDRALYRLRYRRRFADVAERSQIRQPERGAGSDTVLLLG